VSPVRIWAPVRQRLTEAFLAVAQPLDFDHVVLKVNSADLDPQTLGELLTQYKGDAEALLGPDYNEVGIFQLTLDAPKTAGARGVLPAHLSLEGVHKIRFYLSRGRSVSYVVPLSFVQCNADAVNASGCPFRSGDGLALCDIAGLSRTSPEVCVDCGSLNASLRLACSFLPTFMDRLRERTGSARFLGVEEGYLKLAYRPHHERVTQYVKATLQRSGVR
jgi:hypothetical protein